MALPLEKQFKAFNRRNRRDRAESQRTHRKIAIVEFRPKPRNNHQRSAGRWMFSAIFAKSLFSLRLKSFALKLNVKPRRVTVKIF